MNVFDGARSVLDRARLAKVLSMMGSLHDGEVLSAEKTAEALRSQSGNTWAELLGADPAPPQDNSPRSTRATILAGIERTDLLSRELEFLFSLRGFVAPTAKQRAVLERIATKCDVR
jgi:hypothetical protein